MNIALLGSDEWVVDIFDFLFDNFNIISVFTTNKNTPISKWAINKSLKIHYNINEWDIDPDFAIVASFGCILKEDVLKRSKFLNIHPSNLPIYRGCSPVITSILNGDKISSVCIIDVVKNVDSGDIYCKEDFTINDEDNINDLYLKISNISKKLILHTILNFNNIIKHPQIGNPTYTKKYTKLDCYEQNVIENPQIVFRKIKAFGYVTTKINNEIVKIYQGHLENNQFVIDIIQRPNKNKTSFKDFLNGNRGKLIYNKK